MRLRRAFTLIELMVVITIIMILATLLMPAMDRIHESAWRAGCMSNLRQMTQAYFSYAADNGGYIMSSSTGGQYSGAPTWVNTYPVPATQAQMDLSITQGAMFRYINNTTVFKCPSGNNFGNLRSYSMNLVLAGEYGWGNAVRYTTLQAVKRPANTFLFIEEYDDRAQNEGSWVLYKTGTAWVDYVPDLHRDGCTLSFCDGSVLFYTYGDPRTRYICHLANPFYYNSAGGGQPNPRAPLINGIVQQNGTGFPSTNVDYIYLQSVMY